MEKTGAALVIGAGISGMQAALDLAEAGFKVYMVEKQSSIGGKMAQLDKTFPTNDCAMCTMAPRMVAVGRNPDIELLTCSEVVGVEGEAGDFKVKVKKRARYVDFGKCTGCGLCARDCVLKNRIPDEFNGGLSKRGAAYIQFPQAVPLKAAIDPESCLLLVKGKCAQKCVKACSAGAIDFEQKDEIIEINVGAIIVSTGFELFDPSALEEYNYNRYPNILTNLQFERLLSASGPSGGHVTRPSDGKEPKTIAFIQCVGSRDVRHYSYCSKICCMASTKEAIVAKEHNPDLKSYVLYMDLRAFGKGFQEYVNKAKDEYGVEYIRGRVAHIGEAPESHNLRVLYEDTMLGKPEELLVDMVVLASALKPSETAKELSAMLGIETDEYGFFNEKFEEDPSSTAVKGIYITGASQGPKDIPDSVVQSSGAAAKCGAQLKDSRNSLISVREKVPEMEISDDPRIGVFICHCGLNIASVIDVAGVAEHAKKIPGVVHSTDTMYACADITQSEIQKAIKEHNLNRVVIASCTPRSHEPLFRETCEDAGLNPYLFEMANIREHCSWVHSPEPEMATEKAKELTGMAIARARLLESQRKGKVELNTSALVLGGGLAGMTAAIGIASQGFNVDLVERGPELGGSVSEMNSVFLEGRSPESILSPLKDALSDNKNVRVHLNSAFTDLEGFVGNFEATIQKNGESEKIKTGAIVVATGSRELRPEGKYLYGENSGVMTQLELEKALKNNEFDFDTVVMVQCVGARDESSPACSRSCCIEAIKNAMLLKKRNPKGEVFILYRDIMTFGKYEDYYKKSQEELGVKYILYEEKNPPRIMEDGGKLSVKVFDALLGTDVEISADKVVLTTPQVPSEGTGELQKVLKVPLSPDGFFMEAHAKLRPLEFTSDGIYLCGSCQSPKELSSIISQASGAASKVCSLFSKGTLETEAIIARVTSELCIGCGRCEKVCSYGAIKVSGAEEGIFTAQVNEGLCKGCGACTVVCPSGALKASHFTDEQIMAMIEAAAEEL